MHTNQSTDNFEMAQFFRSDIHQQVAPSDIVYTVPTLNGVLHRCGEFAVGTTELLQQHVSEPHVWFANIYGVHKLFYMVIHGSNLNVNDVSCLSG
jgi:hypothetical protein